VKSNLKLSISCVPSTPVLPSFGSLTIAPPTINIIDPTTTERNLTRQAKQSPGVELAEHRNSIASCHRIHGPRRAAHQTVGPSSPSLAKLDLKYLLYPGEHPADQPQHGSGASVATINGHPGTAQHPRPPCNSRHAQHQSYRSLSIASLAPLTSSPGITSHDVPLPSLPPFSTIYLGPQPPQPYQHYNLHGQSYYQQHNPGLPPLAARLPGDEPYAGQKRGAADFGHPADQSQRKGKWTIEEDRLAIELRHKRIKWEDISKQLPGRSATSCRLRYQNYSEKRPEWDDERKNSLAQLYNK
jgi:hypothetical protein